MFVKLCQLFVGVFLLYNTWYSQIWGANQLVLYASVGISLVFMLLDWALVLKRLRLNDINAMVKMYLVFGVYALLSGLFVAIDKGEFIASMFTYISFTLIVFEIWYISYRLKTFKWILDTVYVLALLCAATAIFFGQDYKTEVIVTTMGPYNNPNTLGVFMVFGIFTAVFQKEEFNKYFILKYVSVLAFLYVILLTGSRKALFAGAGLFVFWIVAYYIETKRDRFTWRKMLITVTIVASVVAVVVYIVNVYVQMSGFERLLLLFEEGGTSARLQLMQLAVDYWKTSPIFGIGMDQFKILNPHEYYSHSTYSEVLACTGAVGCLLFFIPIIKLLVTAVKRSIGKGENMYAVRVSLLMLGAELFLGAGQIFIYSVTHMLILTLIANVIYEDIGFGAPENALKIRFKTR